MVIFQQQIVLNSDNSIFQQLIILNSNTALPQLKTLKVQLLAFGLQISEKENINNQNATLIFTFTEFRKVSVLSFSSILSILTVTQNISCLCAIRPLWSGHSNHRFTSIEARTW